MIELKLTPQEIQKVLDALSVRPYHEVYELIPKILDQANQSKIRVGQ